MTDIRFLIGRQKVLYKSVVSIFCPILNETVYFTAEGFHHLLTKSNGKRRKISEQYLKLKCLTYAPDIVKNCTKIIETRKETHKIKGKEKSVVTHELINRSNKKCRNIAVVIERIGTGKLKFRSLKRISRSRFNK